ncbi:heavy metal translocating P-type ATPase [Paludibacterium yongneupense]|uniref:heavy metal translocating P-type ATPase n=1 Tax=Paludibacterium yongneupense TaxID=400061 RepID=UPI0003F758DB|nr:heavy metal translocating P-type ATPase [Paludibacterium yongneupense]
MDKTCFHCGLPIPAGADFPVRSGHDEHASCCAGCQAVAQTIFDAGLSEYYAHRRASKAPVDVLPDDVLQQLQLYDDDTLQKSFVSESAGGREAALMLEGIVCAACVWLCERQLLRQPGVLGVDINYSSRRARVRWDPAVTGLGHLLRTIADLGYRAHPYDAKRLEDIDQRERKRALNRLWVAGLSMMQVMMYAVPIYLSDGHDMETRFLWMLHWASFLLTLPVMVFSAQTFYSGAWREWKSRRVGMDTPVVLGIGTSFGASCWALLAHNAQGVYFDSISMFVFLLLGGRYLESLARRRAGEASESLIRLVPAFVHKLPGWPDSTHSEETPLAALGIGDCVVVRPGEIIPIDGTVLEGVSASNEALMSGESRPVDKAPGACVIAGSLNLSSPLLVRTDAVGEATRLAGIVRLLDQALAQKPRLAQLANRFAAVFVAILLLAALASFLLWLPVSPQRALWIMVSVLVVSCPCALSLATPAALTAAAGHLAQRGVLITRGHALETLAQVSDVVFDKTGTLSHGNMVLLDSWTAAPGARLSLLALAQALETGSEHPLARALRAAATPTRPAVQSVLNHPGYGVEGRVDGRLWRLGRREWVEQLSSAAPPPPWRPADSIVALGDTNGIAALFAIGDSLRDDAAGAIAALRAAGLKVHLLSGDGQGAVEALASRLGITDWRAGATPEDKLDYIDALQGAGARVLMLGDGINDAPVLARADVSIAMGSASDAARSSGDMILINDRLSRVVEAWALARKTRRVIRQNLCWAAAYNLVALPLAMLGHVTPWLASLGMTASSLLVVCNALRLIRREP